MMIDASVWVSRFIADDPNHGASRRWLQQHLESGGTVVTPTLALAEVAGALARRTGMADLGRHSVDAILRAPGLRLVPLDQELAAEAARIAADRRLRGADAVYVASARLLDVPLVTWDEEIHARAPSLIEVRHP